MTVPQVIKVMMKRASKIDALHHLQEFMPFLYLHTRKNMLDSKLWIKNQTKFGDFTSSSHAYFSFVIMK